MIRFFLFFFLFFNGHQSFAAVAPEALSQETQKKFTSVPEFAFIIEEAHKLGIKVYLFGGTASAFAHYVRWDLERRAGDKKYQKERFDYDFTNIYRGNQDLDLVVDGTAEQAEILKETLKSKYPHFVGDREAWEVRLLKEQKGDKQALLGDDEFKKQHTDTNSIGMVALNPDEGEWIYRDLLDWDNPDSTFLSDISQGKIQFLYKETHEETERYQEGKNPPVLAALRYLAKLAQYEVEGTPEDLEVVTQIIQSTDFNDLSYYGKKKAEEFGSKTLLNAPDVEKAWDLLEKTGARKKLIHMDGATIDEVDSLSWWLSKEPLRSSPFGRSGKKARDVFSSEEIIVSHETNSFWAYDNITRSAKGTPNVFISREDKEGETALLGEGFYTRLGEVGAQGTGLTIRFKLHPNAKLGKDFSFDKHDYIIVHNKKALTLIQENLSLNLKDFFALLESGQIDKHDKGLLEKFKRKFSRESTSGEEEYLKDIKVYAEKILELVSYNERKSLRLMMKKGDFGDLFNMVTHFIVNNEITEYIMTQVIPDPKWKDDLSDFIEPYVNDKKYEEMIIQNVLSRSDVHSQLGLVDEFLRRAEVPDHILDHYGLDQVEMRDGDIASYVLTESFSADYPRWMIKIIERGQTSLSSLIRVNFSLPHWGSHSKALEFLIDKLLKEKEHSLLETVVMYVFAYEHTSDQGDLLMKIIKNSPSKDLVPSHVLSKPHFSHRPDLVEIYLKRGDMPHTLIKEVISEEHWSVYPEFVKHFIDKNTEEYDELLKDYIFSKKHWKEHHVFKKFLGSGQKVNLKNLRHAFSKRDFEKFLEKYRSEDQKLSCTQAL